MAKKPPTPEELASLKAAMDASELDFDNAKLAYFRGLPYQDQEVTYEILCQYAKAYIARNYEFQKARFGKVSIRLSVARLLRE